LRFHASAVTEAATQQIPADNIRFYLIKCSHWISKFILTVHAYDLNVKHSQLTSWAGCSYSWSSQYASSPGLRLSWLNTVPLWALLSGMTSP